MTARNNIVILKEVLRLGVPLLIVSGREGEENSGGGGHHSLINILMTQSVNLLQCKGDFVLNFKN